MFSFLFLFFAFVNGHGFMLSPDNKNIGAVRDISKINYQIDSLRNPTTIDCTTLPKSSPISISLVKNKKYTVTLAISIGAQHIGPCELHIIDPDTGNDVIIAQKDNCVSSGTIFDSVSDTGCEIPGGLVTNDMCVVKWRFCPSNLNKITCTECIMKWVWTAKHMEPYEHFETCADVLL
jgi:hypothetical protein